MSLSLQPAATSVPLNGLPAQTIEGASSQPLSFEEVLKVEEKKLQQTINTQSVAALLATIQQPAMPESIHGFDAGNLADSANSVDQPALTTDSVQPAATQPKQQTVLLPQQAATHEKASFSLPTGKAEQIVEANPSQSLKLQTESQPKEMDVPQEQPAATFTVYTKTTPISTPTIDTEDIKEETGVKIPIRADESIAGSTSKSISFKVSTAQSNEEIQVAENAEMPKLSHSSRNTILEARTSTPVTMQIPSDSSETVPVENKPQNLFAADVKLPVESIQTKASDISVTQPVEKYEDMVAKIFVEHLPVAINDNAETNNKVPAVENRPLPEMASAVQVTQPINVTPQPVSTAGTPDEKVISSDAVKQKQAMPIQADIESDSGFILKNVTLNNETSTLKKNVSQLQQRSFVADVNIADENIAVSNKSDKPITDAKMTSPVLANMGRNQTSQFVGETPDLEPQSSTPHIKNETELVQEKEQPTVRVNILANKQSQPVGETDPAVKPVMPKQTDISTSEISQPVKESITLNAKSTVVVTSDDLTTPTTIPGRVNIFADDTSPLVEETIIQNANKAAPETKNEPDVARARNNPMPALVQVNIPVNINSRPVKAEIVAPTQADVLEAEISQPVKEAIAPSMKSVAPEIRNESETENIPTSEKPQPVKKTVVRSAKSTSVEINNEHGKTEMKTSSRAQIEVLESENPQPASETFSPDAKSVQSAQSEIPVAEVSIPAKETVVQTVKSAAPEINNTLSKLDTVVMGQTPFEISASEDSQPAKKLFPASAGTALAQAESLANESSQPVEEAVVQSMRPAIAKLGDELSITKKIAVPVQPEVPASEVSQPVEETASSSVKSERTLPSDEPDTTKIKVVAPVQSEIPPSEMQQPVKKTTAPSVRPVLVEPDSAKVKIDFPVQTEVSASEVSQPVEETASSNVKSVSAEQDATKMKVAAPAQSDDSTNEASYPAKETVAPSSRSVVTEPDMTKVKTAAFVQPEFPASEVPQPAKETVVSSVKPAMTEPDAATTKIDFSMQLDVPASEISQPVNPLMSERDATKKIAVPVESEINDEVHATRTMMAAPMEADVLASEVSQPAKDVAAPITKSVEASATEVKPDIPVRMNVPASEFFQHVDKTSQPVTSQIPAVEAEEAVLKNKNDKAEPSLDVENAAAESRLKVGSRPQIKNEAFVVEQKNALVEIKPERVLQSARVEIKSDEKVTAKEPALDLESNVVIAGIDKGIAGTDVVKKSSVAQVDPMARDVVEQITSQMKTRIKSGETSIHMRLNPEKLGEIEVQMTRTSQGVSVSFITEQASTGQLIESQVNQLRQSLKDAGVQLANLNINQHGQSYQEGGGFRQSQQFVQTSRRDVPLVEDAGTQPQHVGLTSEIDYLV